MSKKNFGNLFAETLIGKQFRFQDCCNRSNVVYTIEQVQFGGYDTDIDDSDPGVEIRCFCKPLDPSQSNNIPVFCFGLEDEIEFIDQSSNANNSSSTSISSQQEMIDRQIEFAQKHGE